MLWPTHTVSKPSSIATLACSLTCPDQVFRFFYHHKINNNRKRWSGHTRLYFAGPVAGRLLLCLIYLVVHYHWTPEDSLRNTFVIPFSNAYPFAFLLVLPYSMVHTCFSALLQVSLLALNSFGSLAL